MLDYISKGSEFVILSDKVSNATKCIVEDFDGENYFTVVLNSDEDFSDKEKVEMFGVKNAGIYYFETQIITALDRRIMVKYPVTHTVLQRREYSRIDFHKNILLISDGKNIRATIMDLSAGGMRIKSDFQFDLTKTYQCDLDLSDDIKISCRFMPIRINSIDNSYIISGRFTLIKNLDRIKLVQFCLDKETEVESK